jgi:hypothetical protein
MSYDRIERDAALIPCEQCHVKPGTEPHACTNQQQWHGHEEIICNCCLECQELCRRANSVPM